MAKTPYLVRPKDSSNYSYRRVIPLDLRENYGRREIKFSLGTSDLKEASELARIRTVEIDQQFADARRQLPAQTTRTLSDPDIERLALLLHRNMLKAEEEMRESGQYIDPDQYERFSQQGQDREVELRAAQARGDYAVVSEVVTDLLHHANIELDQEDAKYRKLSLKVLQVVLDATAKQNARMGGEIVPTPDEPTGVSLDTLPGGRRTVSLASGRPTPSSDEITLSQVFEKYIEERKLEQKTESDFRAYVNRFNELHGDLPLTEITKTHVREFKDAMLKFPSRRTKRLLAMNVPEIIKYADKHPEVARLSPRTVNDKAMGAIGAVLSYASRNGYIEYNPAAGIKVETAKVTKTSRLPYSVEDMNRIFRFPVYTEGDRPTGGKGEAAYWLPILAAFTGARLEELGQLTGGDIKRERGILFLDMTTIHDGKSLKTEASKRRVPIHPTLLELGFLAYFLTRKEERLFPELVASHHTGKLTDAWSKWWGRYARQHGGFDKLKVFHSFRHAAKDAFREGDVPEDLRDELMGHAPRTVGAGYGEGSSIKRLAEAMGKLVYPGLDLNHLAVLKATGKELAQKSE